MTFRFNPGSGTIVITAVITGIGTQAAVRLALDTGANMTMLNRELASNLGYNMESPDRIVRIATASGIMQAPQLAIRGIVALGQQRLNFPVVCHSLPTGVSVDGLLGLDFFRGQRLTIDFREGLITLD